MTQPKRLQRYSQNKSWFIVDDDGEYLTLEVHSTRDGVNTRVMRHKEYDNKRCYYTHIPVRDSKEEWL